MDLFDVMPLASIAGDIPTAEFYAATIAIGQPPLPSLTVCG
jgi:hypothetical protein